MAPIKEMIVLSCTLIVVSISGAISHQTSAMLATRPIGAKAATATLASSAGEISGGYLTHQSALAVAGSSSKRGTTRSFNNGAQSLSRPAGNGGDDDTQVALESAMPSSMANIGEMMQGAMKHKSDFIRAQTERGMQAGEKLKSMMQQNLQGMSMRSSMAGAGNMLSSMQDTLIKSGSQIQNQLKQSLDGHMGRMKGMQGIGDNVLNQARGIGQTISSGLTNTLSQLQKTGEQVRNQIQGGIQQNTKAMSGIMNSMQGSMGKSAKSMQGNMEGLMRQAQGAAQQVTSQLQQVAAKPMELIQNLGNSLGSLMPKQSGGSKSAGRY